MMHSIYFDKTHQYVTNVDIYQVRLDNKIYYEVVGLDRRRAPIVHFTKDGQLKQYEFFRYNSPVLLHKTRREVVRNVKRHNRYIKINHIIWWNDA